MRPSAVDAGVDPRAIDFSEEAGDLIPTGSLARLAGLTEYLPVDVEAVEGLRPPFSAHVRSRACRGRATETAWLGTKPVLGRAPQVRAC
jgi:hypothetical protein